MQNRSRLLVLNIGKYMATIVRTLLLAVFCNDRAFFSSNDRILLARCPRHIQSVFNFIVDNHPYGHPCLMVNRQLSKRVSADQCHLTASRAKVYKLLG